MTPRHILLAVALTATLVAVWLSRESDEAGPGEADGVVAAVPRRVAVSQTTAPLIQPATAPVERFAGGGPDMFPPQTWQPSPAVTTVALPPPQLPPPLPPQAPSLPFNYLGHLDAGEGATYFLAQGERVLSVRIGESQAQWRLDSVDTGGMTFTYLPLQQQRQLRFGP